MEEMLRILLKLKVHKKAKWLQINCRPRAITSKIHSYKKKRVYYLQKYKSFKKKGCAYAKF